MPAINSFQAGIDWYCGYSASLTPLYLWSYGQQFMWPSSREIVIFRVVSPTKCDMDSANGMILSFGFVHINRDVRCKRRECRVVAEGNR